MTNKPDMTESTPQAREPDSAVRALDRLAGTWQISGDAAGTVTYRWLEGGFFLVQEGEVQLFGHQSRLPSSSAVSTDRW